MIKRIKIKGLFSSFDYDIKIPEKGEELILTSPNGYGKTTILSIIQSLCSLDLLYFNCIPFNTIRVEYDSNILEIKSIVNEENQTGDNQIELHSAIHFNLYDSSGKKLIASLKTDKEQIDKAQDSINYMRNLSILKSYKDTLGVDDIKIKDEDKGEIQNRIWVLDALAKTDPLSGQFMIHMRNLTVKAKFIQSQRIVAVNNASYSKTSEIERVAQNLMSKLKRWYLEFLQTSQNHDAKFIDRLMSEGGEISSDEYHNLVSQVSSIINEANRYDFDANFKIPEYSASKSQILKAYIEDVEEKLSILQTPLKSLNLFSRLIADKKFVGKRCIFSKYNGLSFLSNSDESTLIPINSLSSGEKNQIIMLYDLIFNTSDKSILMIDEPEISLHVAWQHEFLKDISEIAKAKDLSVIIATHSPQIIGSRWDECLDLYEQIEESSQEA